MKVKKNSSMGTMIPDKMRLGGITFYKRQGQVIGRVSTSDEKRSNTLPQFIQRQRMRHTVSLWKLLGYSGELMFTEHGNAYQDFASIANRLPAVFLTKRMYCASLLMPGIPVSDGTLAPVKQRLGEVNGVAAMMTDLKVGEWTRGERFWLYSAEQHIEEGSTPRVRFSKSELTRREMTVVDGNLALVGEEYANDMKGWALVRIVGEKCSPQTIVTRCTFYQQYTTEEALQEAAESYGGLTPTPYLSPR